MNFHSLSAPQVIKINNVSSPTTSLTNTCLFVLTIWSRELHVCTLVVDLFLFCYERDFMMYLTDDKQADIIGALTTIFRYLDDILNINNVYFDNMVSYKANTSDTEASFLDLHWSISSDIVSIKIYDKRDDIDFSCFCVCSLLPCGHLLGNGWPLGSCWWCLLYFCYFPMWYPGSGVVLDCIVSWSLPPFLLLKLSIFF